jgi:DNA-binding transcriptional ArsR family regulator
MLAMLKKRTLEENIIELMNQIFNEILRIRSAQRVVDDKISYIESDINRIKTDIRYIATHIEEIYERIASEFKVQSSTNVENGYREREVLKNTIKGYEKEVDIKKKEVFKLNKTDKLILKTLTEKPELGKLGASKIALAIGKGREHTTRRLKVLTDMGYLARDETKWPYEYKVSESKAEEIMRIIRF